MSPPCRNDSALPARLSPKVSAFRSRSRRKASFSAWTSYHDEASDTRVTPTISATINRKLRIRIDASRLFSVNVEEGTAGLCNVAEARALSVRNAQVFPASAVAPTGLFVDLTIWL